MMEHLFQLSSHFLSSYGDTRGEAAMRAEPRAQMRITEKGSRANRISLAEGCLRTAQKVLSQVATRDSPDLIVQNLVKS